VVIILVAILLMAIGGYCIVVILLMVIGGHYLGRYSINGYWWSLS